MSTAEAKEAFIPFSDNSGNPSLALLVCFLRAVLAITSDFRAQLTREVL
jgi:hypothetical protein